MIHHMAHPKQELPSIKALWALLWRGIVLFPVGVLILAIIFAAVAGILLLAIWAVTFGILHQWWQSAGCATAFFLLIYIWYRYSHRTKPASTQNDDRGGYLL
jgi:membrane protein implicated in regulation of membrane protease activity